ncbi:MAG: heme o synthase [Acidobacteria bacterium]|nr:heme o synthase [Acidobacteriota bacterium]
MSMSVAEIGEAAEPLSLRDRLNAYVVLTKPRIAFMLVLTAAAGYYVGSGSPIDYALFGWSMTGIMLLALGVATLNQWFERATDSLMERTAKRPLPAGKVSSIEAFIFGSALTLSAELVFFFLVNPLTALLGLVVIVGYVLMYTPLKTRSTICTAVGAVPGAMPPLMGWTSAANEISLGAWALFALLFLWQFPHFLAIAWLYREQYERAGIKMLPVVDRSGVITARQILLFGFLTLPVSLAPFFFGHAGFIYLGAALFAGIWFFVESFRMSRAKNDKAARRLLLVSVLYLPIVFGALVINSR